MELFSNEQKIALISKHTSTERNQHCIDIEDYLMGADKN